MTPTSPPRPRPTLTFRDTAILRAVAAGSASITGGAMPTLFIDGRCCCDQLAAARLATAGLISSAHPITSGCRAPAHLTASGRMALGEATTTTAAYAPVGSTPPPTPPPTSRPSSRPSPPPSSSPLLRRSQP